VTESFELTRDPRRTLDKHQNDTPIRNFSYQEIENPENNVFDDLIERVESLVNLSGQLCAEIQDRPLKYNLQIFDLGEAEYRLAEPILILIEEYTEDDTIIASFPEIEVFGEGATISEAIVSLKQAILDLFEELNESSPELLGDLPKTWHKVLYRLIIKI
jgi:predicted RNase H-like HicB family nuclease